MIIRALYNAVRWEEQTLARMAEMQGDIRYKQSQQAKIMYEELYKRFRFEDRG